MVEIIDKGESKYDSDNNRCPVDKVQWQSP